MTEVELKCIETSCNIKVEVCFREMLSAWLKMIDPLPSWEGLLAALVTPPVGCEDVAEQVMKELGTFVKYVGDVPGKLAIEYMVACK